MTNNLVRWFESGQQAPLSDLDENELRIAAMEKVILALTPWLDPQVIEDAAATIRAELQTSEGGERVACMQALQLLTDGRMRFASVGAGDYLRGR
jgi:hypothetical protein